MNILSGFWGGILSFFTPCVLPMVPVYLMYLTGAGDIKDLENDRKKTFFRALAFVGGFTIIFVLLGLLSTAVGKAIFKNRLLIQRVAGGLMIIFGIIMTGVIKLPKASSKSMKDAGTFGQAILMGAAFAIGYSPCIGPILGSILIIAANQSTILQGALLLLVYSIGMGLPFIISSFFVTAIRKFVAKYDKAMKIITIIAGLILIIYGILLVINKVNFIS